MGQIAEGAATSLMMPLKISMHRDESNMMITMMVCSTIFAAGVLMGCLMQCVWRKLRGQAVVQLRREIGPRPWPDRPRLGREPLAMPSPPAPTMPSAPDTQPRRVFGLGRPRTDEDDNANRHGPDTDDEDGPPRVRASLPHQHSVSRGARVLDSGCGASRSKSPRRYGRTGAALAIT